MIDIQVAEHETMTKPARGRGKSPKENWARKALTRAGITQADLARKLGVHESSASRFLTEGIRPGMSLKTAVDFCVLVGMSLDEFAKRVGIGEGLGTQVDLQPIDEPPVPTLRLTPDWKGRKGRWVLLAHVNVSTRTLEGITRAFDNAAVDTRKLKEP